MRLMYQSHSRVGVLGLLLVQLFVKKVLNAALNKGLVIIKWEIH